MWLEEDNASKWTIRRLRIYCHTDREAAHQRILVWYGRNASRPSHESDAARRRVNLFMMPAQHRVVDRDDLRARLENLYAKGMPVPEGSDLTEIVLRRIAETAPSGLPEIIYDLFSELAEFPLNDSLQSFYHFVFAGLEDLEGEVLDAQESLLGVLEKNPNANPEGGLQFPFMVGLPAIDSCSFW